MKKFKDSTIGYLFISPVVVVMVIIAIPLLQSLWMSISDWYLLSGTYDHPFVGLENFRSVINQTHFKKMMNTTFEYTFYSVLGKMIMGTLFAVLMNRNFHGRGVLRSLVVIPWAMPSIVVAMLFTLALDPTYGIINKLLISFGITETGIPFISDGALALPTVILVGIWKNFPFVALMLLASLQSVPLNLYEAAEIDGANKWKQFWKISWPFMIPVWIIMLILQIVGTIKEFDLIYLVTAGGPNLNTNVIGLDIYRNAFRFFKLGLASAEGMILMAICTVFAIIYYIVEIKGAEE